MLRDERGEGLYGSIMFIIITIAVLGFFTTSFTLAVDGIGYVENGTRVEDLNLSGIRNTGASDIKVWNVASHLKEALSFEGAGDESLPVWLGFIYWFFIIAGVILMILVVRGVAG